MSTAPIDLSRFLSGLSQRRERLLDLVQVDDEERTALVAELDEFSEQLIVADEELRVQQEELDEARRQLSSLAAERELIVSTSPQALVVTDEHGVVRRTTPAADRLALRGLRRSRPHPIAVWFDVPDRPLIRSMITHRHGGAPSPRRARLRRSDGSTRPVLVELRVSSQPGGEELLQWQLVDLVHDGSLGSEPTSLDAALQIAELAVRLDRAADLDGVRAEVAAEVERLVPEVEGVELVLGDGPDGPGETAGPSRVAGGNVLVVPLPRVSGVTGELVLYARAASSFSAGAEPLAVLVAGHAALAVARRLDAEQLRRAVESGRSVGRAVGILVERHRISPAAAFGRLVRISQRRHVKLRDVARYLEETGLEPDDPTP